MEKRRKFWLVLTTIIFVIFLIAVWIFILSRYEGIELWLLVPFLVLIYILMVIRAYFESDYIDLWKNWLKKKK